MLVDHLLTLTSAQYFRLLKPLTKTLMRRIFAHASRKKTGNLKAKDIRVDRAVGPVGATYSFVCFALEVEPPFLSGTDLIETQYAFLLLIEVDGVLGMFKRHADVPMSMLEGYAESFGYENLGGAFGNANPTYEQISLRGMSLMASTVRRRTIEADNLSQAMSTFGIQRSIPGAFRSRSRVGVHTVTPGSSRIARRNPRTAFDELIVWVAKTGNELKTSDAHYDKSFLANFCHPVPLDQITDRTRANGLLIDVSEAEAAIQASPADFGILHRSARARRNGPRRLSEAAALRFLDRFRTVLTVRNEQVYYPLPSGAEFHLGELRINKASITLRSEFLDQFVLELAEGEKRFTQWMNQRQNFLVTFEDPRFAYTDRQLFEDRRLLDSIPGLLGIIDIVPELATVDDEKHARPAGFGPNSVFYVVEHHVSDPGSLLITDDLGDEWADYIEFAPHSTVPHLTLYHCKHGKRSTSAAKFQDVIGQALKNLSRLHATASEFETRWIASWSGVYSAPMPFPRRRRGDAATAVNVIRETLALPRLERSVAVVVSFLSKQELQVSLGELENGAAKPHITQLLWILSSFVGACREHGVAPRIVCQP